MGKKISVVVPMLNEAPNVRPLHEQLKKALGTLNHEIIFVDDGSTDKTFQILTDIVNQDLMTKVVRLRKNFGKAAAYSAGFENATGDIVVTMDGDLQDDPAEIHKFLAKIDEGYDAVTGWKYRGKGRFDKAIASKIFNRLTSFLTGIKLHDFNCPFKAYRREVLDHIVLYGDLFRFIPVLLADKGYQIAEVKIENHKRQFGRSKYKFSRYLRTFFDMITILFLTKFRHSPLYLFGSMGAMIFGTGFLIDLYLTYRKIFGDLLISKEPLLFLGILLMFIGVQFVSIGLITEMIVNSFHEKGKANYIREILNHEQS